MARQFAGPYEGGSYIRTAIGNCNVSADVAMGAIVDFQEYSEGKEESPLVGLHTSGGLGTGWLLWIYQGELAVYNGTTILKSGIAVPNNLGFCYFGFSHPSGTTKCKFYLYRFATAEWTIKEPATTLGNAAAVAGGTVRFNEWQGKEHSKKLYVCAGIWGANLSEAQHKELVAVTALDEWKAKNSPKGTFLFDQSHTGVSLLDITGGGADQSAINGTSVSSTDPPIPFAVRPPARGSLGLMGVGR